MGNLAISCVSFWWLIEDGRACLEPARARLLRLGLHFTEELLLLLRVCTEGGGAEGKHPPGLRESALGSAGFRG